MKVSIGDWRTAGNGSAMPALNDIVLWSPPTEVFEPLFYHEPEDAPVSRRPILGSRSHAAGFSIDYRDNLIKPSESQIEHNALTVIIADDVKSIECQPRPMKYADRFGVIREHTFDFRVTLYCGRRVAIYVKPSRRVRTQGLQDFVQLLADQLDDDFADEILLITERDLPRWLISNAQLTNSALLDPDQELDERLGLAAELAAASLTIAELSRNFGGAGKTTRSIVRLIHRNILRQSAPGLIEPDTVVVHSSIGPRH